MAGALVLVPNTLDFGVAFGGVAAPLPDLRDVLPLGVIAVAARLPCWVAENAKTTRAFLKRVDAVVPLAQPLQALRIVELPRPQKGGSPNHRQAGAATTATGPKLADLLAPALREGLDIGLMSEAGLPAVADPGAALVQAAHAAGVEVRPLAGPSALLLALAASGLDGQCFAFVGYLPVDAALRAARIRELQALSRRAGQTQIVIETPYRNPALLAALLATLDDATRLSVSCGLTLPGGWTRSGTVSAWRKRGTMMPADVPAVFSWLAR